MNRKYGPSERHAEVAPVNVCNAIGTRAVAIFV